MPSIFDHVTRTNRILQKHKATEKDSRAKARFKQLGQHISGLTLFFSSTKPIIIFSWLWMIFLVLSWWIHSEDKSETMTPVQQVLTLPNTNLVHAAPHNANTNISTEKPTTNTQSAYNAKEITRAPVTKNDNNTSGALSDANKKAIELALSGQASQATVTLEQALLDDPQVGVVFDNLRRLYAGFASQSYQLALEPSKPKPITVELASSDSRIIVQLDTPKANNDVIKPTTTLSAVNTMRQSSATNHNDLETIAEPPAPITPVEKNLPATAPIKTTTPAIIEPTPAQKEAAQRKANQQAIHQALKQWSEAWSKQDVKGYFSSYAPSYSPKSTTRKAWMDYRQERILAPKRIKVELSDVKIVLIKPNLARISFTQSYTSDTLSARNQKSLEFELINQSWLITNESGR